MDGYDKWKKLWEKVESMLPEEKIRWIVANECSCHCTYEWNISAGHFGNCPLQDPNAEMWTFFEGTDIGFVYPK